MSSLKSNSSTKVANDTLARSVLVTSSMNLQDKTDNDDADLQTAYIDMLYEASRILDSCSTLQNILEIPQWL